MSRKIAVARLIFEAHPLSTSMKMVYIGNGITILGEKAKGEENKVIIKIPANSFIEIIDYIHSKTTAPTVKRELGRFLDDNREEVISTMNKYRGGYCETIKFIREPLMLTEGNSDLVNRCVIFLNHPNANTPANKYLDILIQLVCMVDRDYCLYLRNHKEELGIRFLSRPDWLQVMQLPPLIGHVEPEVNQLLGPALYLFSLPSKGNIDEDTAVSLQKRMAAFYNTIGMPDNTAKPMAVSCAAKINKQLSTNTTLIAKNTSYILNYDTGRKLHTNLYAQCKLTLKFGGLSGLKACVSFLQNNNSEVWLIDQVCEEGMKLHDVWEDLKTKNNYAYRKMLGDDNVQWHLVNYPNILHCVKETDATMKGFITTHAPTVSPSILNAALTKNMTVKMTSTSASGIKKRLLETKGFAPVSKEGMFSELFELLRKGVPNQASQDQ